LDNTPNSKVDAKQLVKDAGNRREDDSRREDSNIRNADKYFYFFINITSSANNQSWATDSFL
jgi:hypothetical protein